MNIDDDIDSFLMESTNFESTTTLSLACEFPEIFESYTVPEHVTYETDITYMPEILAQAVQVVKNRYPSVSRNAIINVFLAKTAQVITAKRIKYIEANNADSGYPNYYAINFMPSGSGKDRILRDLDNFFFRLFRRSFNSDCQNYKDSQFQEITRNTQIKFPREEQEKQRKSYIKDEMGKIRNLVLEVSDGTREGLYSDAKAFKQAKFGSIMITNSEFGQLLKNPTNEQIQFLKQMFTAYDGKITAKSIKGEQRETDIYDIPVNVHFHSDPTLFEYDLKKMFNSLLETGLGRRAVITFMDKFTPCEVQQDPQIALEEQRQYFQDLTILGYKLFERIEKIELGTTFKVTEETFKNVLYPYKLKLDTLANKEEKALLKKEILSRELKVIKVSCIYACVNHPTEHFINSNDMQMAIDTIEELSEDYYNFYTHTPNYEDKYDRGFNFFFEHKDQKFKKNELITNYHQHFGLSRDKFKDGFEKYIDTVKEIAVSKGYFLNEVSINHNSGSEFMLVRLEPQELSDFVIPLDKLLV